jgi:hypothetical protein
VVIVFSAPSKWINASKICGEDMRRKKSVISYSVFMNIRWVISIPGKILPRKIFLLHRYVEVRYTTPGADKPRP